MLCRLSLLSWTVLLLGHYAVAFTCTTYRGSHFFRSVASLRESSPFEAVVLAMTSSDDLENGHAPVLEVEQKFELTDGANWTAVEEKLREMGMECKGEITMVDWYFDLPAPRWALTPKDCWLRYRETRGRVGAWQLKIGRRHKGGATVYEEVEGLDAIKTSLSMLPPYDPALQEEPVEEEYEGYAVPQVPVLETNPPCGIVPFARIETRRSSWSLLKDEGSSSLRGLAVDLDGTDFGYMVGEVEAVVPDETGIEDAMERIESLVAKLTPNQPSDSGAAVGKLEFYLMTNKPDHYDVCVQTGSIVPERGSNRPT